MRRWVLCFLLLPATVMAQQPSPSCEDKLAVAEALSANKEQMMANLVAQMRALQKQIEEARKSKEGVKP